MADTLRVRMMTMASGPDFQARPGDEIDLPRERAEEMVAGGYAERTATAAAEPAPPESVRTPDEAPDAGPPEAPPTLSAPAETATAAPQRNGDADEQLAAERAGADAARAKAARSTNPYNGRSTLGRAWFRGWDSVT